MYNDTTQCHNNRCTKYNLTNQEQDQPHLNKNVTSDVVQLAEVTRTVRHQYRMAVDTCHGTVSRQCIWRDIIYLTTEMSATDARAHKLRFCNQNTT